MTAKRSAIAAAMSVAHKVARDAIARSGETDTPSKAEMRHRLIVELDESVQHFMLLALSLLSTIPPEARANLLGQFQDRS